MDPGTVIGTAIGVATGLAIPGTIAVFKFVPSFSRNGNGNGNGAIGSQLRTMQDGLRQVIDDRLAPVLKNQTEILERMRQTLLDNTTALQIFMKLEEQRERFRAGD